MVASQSVKPARGWRTIGLWSLAGALCIAAALNDSPFGPRRYSGAELTFRVVDDQRQPIVGAVALMTWYLYEPNGRSQRVFHVMEAESDSAGDIRFPAWGPIDTSRGGRIVSYMPSIRVFKPGHLVFFDRNTSADTGPGAPALGPPQWNNQVIVLAVADRRSELYVKQLRGLVASMDFYTAFQQCWSDTHHRMIDLLNPELDEVVPPDLSDRVVLPNRTNCPSAGGATRP